MNQEHPGAESSVLSLSLSFFLSSGNTLKVVVSKGDRNIYYTFNSSPGSYAVYTIRNLNQDSIFMQNILVGYSSQVYHWQVLKHNHDA